LFLPTAENSYFINKLDLLSITSAPLVKTLANLKDLFYNSLVVSKRFKIIAKISLLKLLITQTPINY
jgi:hypothetical protein